MKNIVITGASSGFGWAFAEKFLQNPDWTVHATTRSGQLDAAAELPPEQRARLKTYALNLESSEQLRRFHSELLNQTSRIDVLINNAGYGLFGALEDLSETQLRRQMEVNFFGTVLLTQSLLPALRESHGHIFNLSSVLGSSGLPLTSMYCASKFALEGWSESLGLELAPHGVTVTVLQPGAHRTKFGAQVEWGENSEPAFAAQTMGYRRLLVKLMSKNNPARPESVALKVYKIVQRGRVPHRLRFGKDAHMGYWLRRLLPTALVLKMTDRLFRRLFMLHVRT